MSTDLPDRLSVSYPVRDIDLPPVDELWERGQRRQRHRSAGIAAVATAAVAVGGFVAAGLVPPASPPSPVISEPAGTAEEETTLDQESQLVPEPAREGDVPSSENVPEPADPASVTSTATTADPGDDPE